MVSGTISASKINVEETPEPDARVVVIPFPAVRATFVDGSLSKTGSECLVYGLGERAGDEAVGGSSLAM